jgi:hypothetical protein
MTDGEAAGDGRGAAGDSAEAGAAAGGSCETAGVAIAALQNGQAGARSEIRLPHAGHAISMNPTARSG